MAWEGEKERRIEGGREGGSEEGRDRRRGRKGEKEGERAHLVRELMGTTPTISLHNSQLVQQ